MRIDRPANIVESSVVFAFSSRQQLHQNKHASSRETAMEKTKWDVKGSISPFYDEMLTLQAYTRATKESKLGINGNCLNIMGETPQGINHGMLR